MQTVGLHQQVGLELNVEVLEEARGSGRSIGARPHMREDSHSAPLLPRLDDAWRAKFGDEFERPHWAELLRSGVAIFDLDLDAILSAIYALFVSPEGDCYLCVPPDTGIEAAALGACESSLPGTAPADALHTFSLDSGASCCFFRDSTTLTPLPAPVPARLADPSGGPVVARSSTVLLCPAHPLARVASCRTRLFSGTTALVTPPCHACVACTPASLSLVFPGFCLTSPPCLPCVEGRQRAAPHSSSFPSTIAPLQTLHMDVWGPACVSGQGRERYFPLVVDDYSRYTTVFPLRIKGEDLPVLRLHSDRGSEFSSDLLRDICRGEGTTQSFMLLASPQQNGIAERCIGLVMEVARTSMIHAAAPHFMWSFAVWYAAHQLILWPRVSLPETLPTRRWTGKVGVASVAKIHSSTVVS
ncbi:unnamed protein product [Closterium sp. NIES-54]